MTVDWFSKGKPLFSNVMTIVYSNRVDYTLLFIIVYNLIYYVIVTNRWHAHNIIRINTIVFVLVDNFVTVRGVRMKSLLYTTLMTRKPLKNCTVIIHTISCGPEILCRIKYTKTLCCPYKYIHYVLLCHASRIELIIF